jgi:predicted DNA-binding transcriptional regulator AlpA
MGKSVGKSPGNWLTHTRSMKVNGREPDTLPSAVKRPVISAEEAFAHLGIDRTTGYRAIREGQFPVEVIRIGRVIRVPTNALRRLLDLDVGNPPGEDGTEDSHSTAHVGSAK